MDKADFGKLKGASARISPVDCPQGLSFTGRIARWSAIHRWWVVGASFLFVVLAMVVLNTVETKTFDYNGEGESSTGFDLIEDRFDTVAVPTEQLVFSNPSLNVSSPVYRATVQGLVEVLRALPEVQSVASFYDTQDPGMVSGNGSVLLAQVVIARDADDAIDKVDTILDAVREAGATAEGFEIAIAGSSSLEKQLEDIEKEDFGIMIIVTMVLALTLMLVAFRAAVAAVLPVILAVGSIFGALGIAALVSHVYPMIEFLAQIILLMGMAVGVDHSLFIVSRFRNERKAGRSKLEAITVASNTTGRAVFYAGMTVLLSLVGLFLTDSAIFAAMSIGVIIVVMVAIIASLTLLPAMLAVLGDNINRLRLPIIGREKDNEGGMWSTITDKVLKRPGVLATISAAGLIALAIPLFSLNLGFNTGADSYNDAVEGKRALKLLEEHFNVGLAQPAYVVVDAFDVNSAQVQASVDNLLQQVEGDEAFFPPFNIQVNEAGDLLYVEVPIIGTIDDQVSLDVVRHLSDDIVPAAFEGSGAQVYVSGVTAGSLDFTERMVDSAPYVFAFVLGLAFVLLTVMFRSVVIPVKAIVLDLLSVGAAYGVVVMVFQWGWGIGLLGSDATGIIGAWLPLFLFTILFGLSMDYHMLILSRIKEAHDQGYSNEESVSLGIKLTAGQVTAAAAVMVRVFGSFALGGEIETQQMGLGLGVAVLIDATVVRSVLLPASMKLLGERNWYLPSWLDWLPKASTEGPAMETPATDVVPAGAD